MPAGSTEVEEAPSNRELAEAIFTAMNERDPAHLGPYLSEDAVFDFPGPGLIEGPRKILVFLKVLFRKYPRLEFSIEDILVEGDRACAVWTNQGEDKKGNPYQNRGITLMRFSEGKIVFISDYFKDTSFVEAS
jgi:ketosteroid isomerase-like protein